MPFSTTQYLLVTEDGDLTLNPDDLRVLRDESDPAKQVERVLQHAHTTPLVTALLSPLDFFNYPGDLFLREVLFRHGVAERAQREDVSGIFRLHMSFERLRVIEVPSLEGGRRLGWAIMQAKERYREANYEAWAHGWLEGTDRTKEGARSAATLAFGMFQRLVDADFSPKSDAFCAAKVASAAAEWAGRKQKGNNDGERGQSE